VLSVRNEINFSQDKEHVFVLEKCHLLGCGAVWVYYKPMFQRNVPPPSSGQKK
jgi:hypothetical protein